MSHLHNLRETVHDHILRNTICPDPDIQRDRQAAATEKHEAEQAEREQYLASLVVKEGGPASDEPLLRSRLKPLPTKRVPTARSRIKTTQQITKDKTK